MVNVLVAMMQPGVVIYLDIEIMMVLKQGYLSRHDGIPVFQIMSQKNTPLSVMKI